MNESYKIGRYLVKIDNVNNHIKIIRPTDELGLSSNFMCYDDFIGGTKEDIEYLCLCLYKILNPPKWNYDKDKCGCCRELTTKEIDGKSVLTCKIFPKCEYSDHYRTAEEAGISDEELKNGYKDMYPYYPPG